MRIGLDISQIVYKGSGVSRFTYGLINSVLTSNTKHQFIFYFSSLRENFPKNLEADIKKSKHKLIKFKYPPSLLSFFVYKLRFLSSLFLPIVVSINKNTDFFITSDWIEYPLKVKKATIIHDLVFKKFQNTLPDIIIYNQTQRFKYIIKESTIVFADSVSTKNDISEFFKIDNKKIILNYPGVEPILDNKNISSEFLSFIKENSPYILSVGKLEPRKNITILKDAFTELNIPNLKLLIVGMNGWGQSNSATANTNIKYLGYVNDDMLQTLYKNASLFVYPSLYEGFGYPVIEAMLNGCPVATSNNSSLYEIGKTYALIFNPESKDSIKKSILESFDKKTDMENLTKKAQIYARSFSWSRYFNTLTTEIEKVTISNI